MKSFFSSAFCFLVGESEDEYTWAIEQFNTVIREQDLRMPNVVVTDNCRAMKNALTVADNDISRTSPIALYLAYCPTSAASYKGSLQ